MPFISPFIISSVKPLDNLSPFQGFSFFSKAFASLPEVNPQTRYVLFSRARLSRGIVHHALRINPTKMRCTPHWHFTLWHSSLSINIMVYDFPIMLFLLTPGVLLLPQGLPIYLYKRLCPHRVDRTLGKITESPWLFAGISSENIRHNLFIKFLIS